MSTPERTPPDMPDREGLAAEYVLGTLPPEDRAAAERLLARDTDFARLVAAWTARLAPLDAGYGEEPAPPEVLARVEARLFPGQARAPDRPPARHTRPRWQIPLWGALAAALALAVLWVSEPGSHPVVATLTAPGEPLRVAAQYGRGELVFTRAAGPAAPSGRDYELWVIPPAGAPVSLGLLRDDPVRVALAELAPGTTLAVSLEPAGGSPSGQPTGAVLVTATIPG